MPPKLPKSLQVLLSKLKQAITDIFDRFEEGELSAVKWRDSMKSILTRFITASFMSGQESPLIGVTEQGYIYEYIKAQLGFIDNFYLSIVSSDEFKAGWRQRAESYANSIVAPFWKGETKMVALPAMPGDMTTPCGQLCACLWDVQAIDEEKGDYDAYWRLNASREIETEHCQICEQRSKEWNPLKIRDNMLVIPPGEAGKEFIEHIKEYLEETSKGGPGSGHFGHAGRPGEIGGSAAGGNNQNEFIKTISDQHNEHLRIYDDSGNILVDKMGTDLDVQLTPAENLLAENAIVIHNHPSLGGGFSEDDIRLAALHKPKEMIIVDKKYIYTLSEVKTDWSEAIRRYGELSREYYGTGQNKIKSGEITRDQFHSNLAHNIMRNLSAELGWNYKRESI